MSIKKRMYRAFLLFFIKVSVSPVHGFWNEFKFYPKFETPWCSADDSCSFGYYCDKFILSRHGTCKKLETIGLSQSDFDAGTYRITTAGEYVLTEDISFAPHSANNTQSYDRSTVLECCKPRPEQFVSNGGTYPDLPYSLGFFAAITVETKYVHIDLRGYTIEQSKEHALMQRFFAVIELASSPFIPGQGPANFGPEISSGRYVRVRNGTIGRSSHHGIHGNDNYRVYIDDVAFKDFEVAAVALNGVNGLVIRNSSAKSRLDVPVTGRFSGSMFVYHYVKALHEKGVGTELAVAGVQKTAANIRTELEDAIVNVYEDIVINDRETIDSSEHPDEYAIFHNAKKVVDGNAYGFLTNSLGVAVNGFPWTKDKDDKHRHSKNINFESVTVHDLQADIKEVIALKRADIGKSVNDPLGNVLQLRNVHPDDETKLITISSHDDEEAEYKGNVVTNAQLFVAKCILEGKVPDSLHLPITTNTINADIVTWAEASGTTQPERFLSDLLTKLAPDPEDIGYFCDGDTMFHVNKGIVGFKIDNTDEATLQDCHVVNMTNFGASGSTICGKYYRSHPKDTISGYGGAAVRAFSFAGSNDVHVKDSSVSKLISQHGCAVGYDIMTDSSNIKLESCTTNTVKALGGGSSPQTVYDGCGVVFGQASKDCELKEYCFQTPHSVFGRSVKVMDGGRSNVVENEICEKI
mmetsp:Transcript_30013/g.36584  ORF Transcript_30013/g.36584 Transcript_30013/m.36584 type:complete len:693 (-) Transcript_30013:6-2084(-)